MEIKIKLNANRVYRVSNFGKIESDILEQLYERPEITKQISNVSKSVENMLYNGHPVTSIQFDMLTVVAILNVDTKK
jgi:hypothetical protein